MKKMWLIRRPSLGDVTASELECADDVGMFDWTAAQASERVSALASGSSTSASMEILAPKPSGMHVHISVSDYQCRRKLRPLTSLTAGPNGERAFPTTRGSAVRRAS